MAEEFKTPGERLREAREARQLSLAAVAERTKIPERLLAALEQDDHSKVSGPLYVKSFLRNFAQAVGLDPEEVLELYRQQPGTEAPAPAVPLSEQDLGPREAPEPVPVPQTIARPPEDHAAAGGEVWREEVEVRRLGISAGARLGLWLAALAVLAVAILLIVRAAGDGGEAAAERTEDQAREEPAAPPAAARQAPAEEAGPPGGRADAAAPARDMRTRMAALDRDTLVVVEPPAGPPPSTTPAVRLPAAPAADRDLPLAGVTDPDLVLGMRLGDCRPDLRCAPDSRGAPTAVTWPSGDPPPLPARDIRAGVPYAVRGGWVVYWWARDHFLVRIPDRHCIEEVRLNGRRLPIPGSVVGREWLVDAATAGP